MHDIFQHKVKNKKLITVFYECGSGGEFLVWLLGMHQKIAARNFAVDKFNRWTINDNFCRMAGRGLEDSLDNWQFIDNIDWYISRDHANLLYPINKWQDWKNRTLNEGIDEFNNLYSLYWKQSKTIWLDIDTIEDLTFVDRLGAIKNFKQSHMHYSDSQYEARFIDIKHRLKIKQQRFQGEFITVSVRDIWLNNTKKELNRIITFLNLDDTYVDIWTYMIEFWNSKNSQLLCNYKNCVPIEL
jgi:Zn-finger nucleic acid-binding protein